METYLLCSSTGEKVDGRKNAVGFRLWIRCQAFWDDFWKMKKGDNKSDNSILIAFSGSGIDNIEWS